MTIDMVKDRLMMVCCRILHTACLIQDGLEKEEIINAIQEINFSVEEMRQVLNSFSHKLDQMKGEK